MSYDHRASLWSQDLSYDHKLCPMIIRHVLWKNHHHSASIPSTDMIPVAITAGRAIWRWGHVWRSSDRLYDRRTFLLRLQDTPYVHSTFVASSQNELDDRKAIPIVRGTLIAIIGHVLWPSAMFYGKSIVLRSYVMSYDHRSRIMNMWHVFRMKRLLIVRYAPPS